MSVEFCSYSGEDNCAIFYTFNTLEEGKNRKRKVTYEGRTYEKIDNSAKSGQINNIKSAFKEVYGTDGLGLSDRKMNLFKAIEKKDINKIEDTAYGLFLEKYNEPCNLEVLCCVTRAIKTILFQAYTRLVSKEDEYLLSCNRKKYFDLLDDIWLWLQML